MRVTSGAVWSSLYLPAGKALANRSFPLFDVARGKRGPQGRLFGLSDTNLREACRMPAEGAFNCERVSWIVRECSGQTDVEKLAQAYGRSMADLIMEHGTLYWDFARAHLDIAPLWLGSVPQLVTVSGNKRWTIVLAFGHGAPQLDLDHVLRVTLSGQFKHSIEFG